MDPMQIQNQQANGVIQQPVAPIQNMPQQIPQQQIQPVVQEDGVFDKILKGIVDFIAKIAAPVPATPVVSQQQPIQGGVQIQQPQVQNMPGANFFNKIGNTLDAIGNQANQIVQTGTSTVLEGAQNYVAEKPTAPLDTQQFLSQNYQANAAPIQQPVAPIQQPVAPIQQPVAPIQQPVAPIQQPVAPIQQPVAPIQQPVAPIQQPVAPIQQ
ncbi:hypothetical protein P148_SR1C00001G0340 [candidate division SR1 bacterium RAAC1_SR1_1]|nr:hypothetical protein P148_SR1C00001G0340 [candidate division SR1 bacterium RAAC1_SR1_1]